MCFCNRSINPFACPARFRCVLLDPLGHPWRSGGVSLTLFGPGGGQVARWRRPTRSNDGVVDIRFALAARTPVGRWTLTLTAGPHVSKKVNFWVQESRAMECRVVLPSQRFSYVDSTSGRMEVFYQEGMGTFPAEVILEAVATGKEMEWWISIMRTTYMIYL